MTWLDVNYCSARRHYDNFSNGNGNEAGKDGREPSAAGLRKTDVRARENLQLSSSSLNSYYLLLKKCQKWSLQARPSPLLMEGNGLFYKSPLSRLIWTKSGDNVGRCERHRTDARGPAPVPGPPESPVFCHRDRTGIAWHGPMLLIGQWSMNGGGPE